MAIDTAKRRNAAFLDACGILIPDVLIDDDDRQVLVGCYSLSVYGPVCIAEATTYTPGASRGANYIPGPMKLSTYIPGIQRGQLVCNE